MGSNSRYRQKGLDVSGKRAKADEHAQPIMLATRSGTIVCVNKVATKKIAPTRANMLAA